MRDKDKELFDKAISWAKKKGFNDLKANAEDYEQPRAFNKTGEDEPFIPDITGITLGTKHYVEIAIKKPNERRVVSKWKLFSTLASMKGGKLYLLAPKGHKAYTDKLVEKYHVDATVISI